MTLLLGDQGAGLCWLLHKMTPLLGNPGGGAVLVAPQDDPVARRSKGRAVVDTSFFLFRCVIVCVSHPT